MRLLQMTISAGILIGFILILRHVGRRLFSARFLYLLWFVAVARMAFPLELPVRLPVQLPGIGMEYILRHEYVHIRRFDNLWKIVVLAVVCVHWFNPFAWVMWRCFNRDMELACDQCAVAGMDGSGRRAYAMTLLRFAEKNHKVSLLCNSFGKNAVKERIMMLMKNHRKTKLGIVCSVLVMTLSMTVFASVSGSSSGTAESAVGKSPAVILSETPQFSEYEALGLSYDTQTGPLSYDGKLVESIRDSAGCGISVFGAVASLGQTTCLQIERDENGGVAEVRQMTPEEMPEVLRQTIGVYRTENGWEGE